MSDDSIGRYYARKEQERRAAYDRLIEAKAHYAEVQTRRPLDPDGYPIVTDEQNEAYRQLWQAEKAYELAAYVGD